MRTMRGMVLRVEERHVVVVTEEGDFLRVRMPARRPLPGQTLEIPVKRRRAFRPYLAVAAVLVLAVALSVLRPLAIAPAVASVALDMTPSVELAVSKDNEVVSAQAHNPEGESLLKDLQVKGLDVYQAVNLITARAAEMNFFNPEDKNIVVAVVMPLRDEKGETGIDKDEIMRIIHDEMLAREYDGYVVVNQARKEIRRQAVEAGLPVNRYLLLEKSREQGIEIAPETLRSSSLQQVMDGAHMEVQETFPGSWCEVSGRRGMMNGPMGGMGFSSGDTDLSGSGTGQGSGNQDNTAGGEPSQPAPGTPSENPWWGMRSMGPMGPMRQMGPMNPGFNRGRMPWPGGWQSSPDSSVEGEKNQGGS